MNMLTLLAIAQVLTDKLYTKPSLKIIHVKGTILVGEIQTAETSPQRKLFSDSIWVYLKENFCPRITGHDDRKTKQHVDFPTQQTSNINNSAWKNWIEKNTWEDPNPFYTRKTFNHVEPKHICFEDDVLLQFADFEWFQPSKKNL